MLQNLYPHLLAFHGLFFWFVLAAALAAIFVALSGWSGTKPASANLLRFSIIFVVLMDVEFIAGLLLYLGASSGTRATVLSHAALMFMAVACAHIGGALSRKGRNDLMKYRGAAIADAISLLLLLSGLPWRALIKFAS
jgi:hypothetical protein